MIKFDKITIVKQGNQIQAKTDINNIKATKRLQKKLLMIT